MYFAICEVKSEIGFDFSESNPIVLCIGYDLLEIKTMAKKTHFLFFIYKLAVLNFHNDLNIQRPLMTTISKRY